MTNTQIIQDFLENNRLPDFADRTTLLSGEARQLPTLKIDQSFYLQGGNGIGKTHFATLFLRDWICKKFPNGFEIGKYRELPDFVPFDRFEQYIRNKNGFDSDEKYGAKLALDQIKTSKFLILDDFWLSEGTPHFKQLMFSELFDIFDYRYKNRAELQTVVTTNLCFTKLDNIDKNFGRIISRIVGICSELELPKSFDRRFAGKINLVENAEIQKAGKIIF